MFTIRAVREESTYWPQCIDGTCPSVPGTSLRRRFDRAKVRVSVTMPGGKMGGGGRGETHNPCKLHISHTGRL